MKEMVEEGLKMLVFRKKAKLKQTELAKMAGVSMQWIHKIETGESSPSKDLGKRIEEVLAKELNVDSVDIFGDNLGKKGK